MDKRKNSLSFPRYRQLSGRIKRLAQVWAGLVFILALSYFLLPRETNILAFFLFIAINGFCLGLLFLWVKQVDTCTEEFRSLVSHSRELMWTLDSQLNITGVCGAVKDLAGREAQDLMHIPITQLLSQEEQRRFTSLVRDKNSAFSMETVIQRAENDFLAVEIAVTPIHGSCQDAFHGVIRDISEQKKQGRKERRLEEKLDRSEKLKNLGILAGSVAHDLNNILSGIATYPEVLLMDENLEPKVKQGLSMIKDSGRKASSVVSDLLTISRGIKADKQILNINTVIERYMSAPEFQKTRLSYSQVDIEVTMEPELLNISGSYIHIEKAIMNLMLNAVEETGPKENGKVVLSTSNFYVDGSHDDEQNQDLTQGEYVLLEVSDNGSGIPESCLDKIFDPFFTQKEMGKSGTGLGLTVVHNTVQDHRGVIRVDSHENGTRFNLFFPAIRAELPKPDDPGSVEEIKGNGEVLLVVDDLASQRKIASTILKNLGYKVFTVADGIAALEFVKQTPADLLVLDMIMAPAISGLETYELIKEVYPDQKAIIASGHSESEDVLKAQELGAGSFVKKPYTILDMGIAVKEELEK
ncbi:MAG: ATP-binding protein [Desulfobacterales bacterium]|nr:ATP-binding protein [Desulfobacterales bacterium]